MPLQPVEFTEECLERIQVLENEVRETKNIVRELQRRLPAPSNGETQPHGEKQPTVAEIAEELGISDHLSALKAEAEALFGTTVAISVGKFPEFPEDKYLVLEVTLPRTSDIKEVVDKKFKWYEAVIDAMPNTSPSLCIAIHYE